MVRTYTRPLGRNAAPVAGSVSAGDLFLHGATDHRFCFSCAFFFFENWPYTATYMADARAQVLPLVTTGDPDFVEHDWFAIFSRLGVLNHDTEIASVVRVLGWCGMIACVCWLATRVQDVPTDVADEPLRELILRRRLQAVQGNPVGNQKPGTDKSVTAPNPR